MKKSSEMPFETVLQQLSTNSPDMKELSLEKIIINPVEMPGPVWGNFTVSHIHDDDLFKLAEAFKKNHTLERIIIDGSDSTREWRSTEAGAIAIGESLKDHPTLNSIVVSLDTLEEKKIFGFFQSLAGSANIKRLWVDIYCGYEFLNELGDLLAKKKSVEHIYISGGQLKKGRYKPFPLTNFFEGIGAQNRLSSLFLNYIILDEQDLNELAFAMRDVNSLTSIKLKSCQIPPSEITHICSIVKNNPLLSELDLSHNPLKDLGIKEITRILPSLQKLKILGLRKTDLTNESLKSLVSTFLEEKLYISTLDLSSNPIDNSSILLINQLIDANPRLKNLYLDFCKINSKHIQQMIPVLKDPKKCLLEMFSFVGGDQDFMPINFSQIMYQNENICLNPPFFSHEDSVARYINRAKRFHKEWDMFIDATICLSQAHFAPTKSDIKPLPGIIILYILSYVVPDTNNQTNSSILCRDLIFKNLKNRHILMNEGKYIQNIDLKKYDVENNCKVIKEKWWSSTFITEYKDNMRTLLVPATTLYPHYLKLGEIVSIVESTLKEYKVSETTTTSIQEVNINISNLNNADQRRILGVFKRFLRMHYEDCSMENQPAHLTDSGILKIKGISLSSFRALIKKIEEPVPETKSNCLIM